MSRRKSDEAYGELRSRIMMAVLPPNAVLDEKSLTEDLGIGRTPLRGFDAGRTPPFLLEPGDYVQFNSISQAEYFSLRRQIEAGQYKLQLQEIEEAER